MAWSIREVAAPDSEPITLAEAKLELRIDHDDEDGRLSTKITAAREQVEADAQQYVVRTTRELVLDALPDDGIVAFPYRPIGSVVSVLVFDADGVETDVDPEYFTVEAGRVILDTDLSAEWLPESLRSTRVAIVRFVAGPATTPAWAVEAMMQWLRYDRWKDPNDLKAYDRVIDPRRPVGVA